VFLRPAPGSAAGRFRFYRGFIAGNNDPRPEVDALERQRGDTQVTKIVTIGRKR
jgi:hypothetical protein